MPTGYTEILERLPGLTLREFALRCARNFGALVHMRDEPLDAPLPDKIVPSDYHEKRISEARAQLSTIESMSDDDLRLEIERLRCEVRERNAQFFAEHERKTAAYARMRELVEAWTPPTPDHVGLKRFMLEQIRVSYDAECPMYQMKEPTSDVSELRRERIQDVRDNIAYHERAHADECRRASERNAWLQSLRSSLPENQ